MRIAHLTDMHLRHQLPAPCVVPRRRSHDMPARVAEALANIRQRDIDLLAVTGDLVDVPDWIEQPLAGFTYDDAAAWRDMAIKDYRLVRSLLDDSGLRYVVLPGNHDAESIMWQVFDPDANECDVAGHHVARFCDREQESHAPHRYVPQRLRWRELVAAKDGLPQIHLQHYIFNASADQHYPHAYAGAAFMRAANAASARVRLCLSGHYHRGLPLTRDGTCHFSVAPAFCEWPHPWREYDLDDDGRSCEATDHRLGHDPARTRRVVFIDRDGVINDRASYHAGPEAMRLIPGSAAGIRRLNDARLAVVVVTNQSAVGMGFVPRSIVSAVHDRMCRLLAQEAGAKVDAIYSAYGAGPHAALPGYEDTARAKPRPTMLLEARDELALDLTDAWMIGDNITDAQAGAAAGAKPILVLTGHGQAMREKYEAEFPHAPIADDLRQAVEIILAR